MIFDGKAFAQEKEAALRKQVEILGQKGTIPKLVTILIGNNPESELYLKLKGDFATRIGAVAELHHFQESADIQEAVKFIKAMNSDSKVLGIMIQSPIPETFDICDLIDPKKDVDCLTSENLGRVMTGKIRFLPATVKAVVEIIKSATDQLTGKNAVIIGASEIVGKPLAMVLSDGGATVAICRSTTRNLPEFTKNADILISATGSPGLIKKEMVKNGSIVIDVGISRIAEKVVGDVDKGVETVAEFLTPVPGGVGPVTVACLFENLLLTSS